ncbi:DUF3828 domain-containing protein [Ralstonia holmesii]|uniref:DUF3828 domain-containing protein n=1 Tax=Ralstonia holmesii TaxID=3058602 RepID=A0ABC8QKC9_9RALS|nr:DUF3828 domain-containing protein [Ralstonia sp. LMG 32967]CAJ0800131.1 hypothetical protein LMG18096_03794 [Ralstonia sp. LMG 32967]CAJ0818814.1 hypothetical protein LMG18093_03817 [Ralstonia sp. LMG 32967]
MTRFLSLLVAVVCAVAVSSASAAQAAVSKNTPEAAVISFYTWFIQHDSDQTYPLREPDIERYVAKDTVARLRNDYAHAGPPNGVDYFLKVQDYDSRDWLAHMQVQRALMLGDVAIVAVSFGSQNPVHVLVFMKRLDADWKIIKIDDTWEYR